MNAVMILPVHRFTSGSSLQPMAGAARLREALTPLLACLETLDRRLRGTGATGHIAGIGLGCFSAGSDPASRAFASGQRRSDIELVRGIAFVDAVPTSATPVMQSLVGTNATPGWLDLLPAIGLRDAAIYQQSNSGERSVLAAARRVLRNPYDQRITRGVTEFVPGRSTPAFNELALHWVDTAALGAALGESPPPSDANPFMFWHGRISRSFMENTMTFLRHGFDR